MTVKRIVYLLLSIFVIGLVILVMYIFSCCMFDFTDEGEAIIIPLKNEYVSFFKKYKRTPTAQESYVMLSRAGCEKVTHLTEEVHNGSYFINLVDQNFICEYDSADLYFAYSLGSRSGSLGGGASKVSASNLNSSISINALSTVYQIDFSREGSPNNRKYICQKSVNFPLPGSR